MNKKYFNRLCIIIGTIFWIIGLFFLSETLADEVITINPVVTPEPSPKPRPIGEIVEFELEESTKNLLAEFLWKSPADTQEEKEALLWIVFNRVDHNNLFGNTIKDNLKESEFGFLEKHRYKISEENLQIVQSCYNLWCSYKNGNYTGKLPYPRTAYYCSFIDGGLYLFGEIGGECIYVCS